MNVCNKYGFVDIFGTRPCCCNLYTNPRRLCSEKTKVNELRYVKSIFSHLELAQKNTSGVYRHRRPRSQTSLADPCLPTVLLCEWLTQEIVFGDREEVVWNKKLARRINYRWWARSVCVCVSRIEFCPLSNWMNGKILWIIFLDKFPGRSYNFTTDQSTLTDSIIFNQGGMGVYGSLTRALSSLSPLF